MAATERPDRHAARRFVTRTHVEDAAAAGQSVRLRGRDVLTDEAAQRAADLGVRVERETTALARRAPVRPAPSADSLRRAVRAAVVAELGSEPVGLDAAIDKVLRRRSTEGHGSTGT